MKSWKEEGAKEYWLTGQSCRVYVQGLAKGRIGDSGDMNWMITRVSRSSLSRLNVGFFSRQRADPRRGSNVSIECRQMSRHTLFKGLFCSAHDTRRARKAHP